MGPGTRRSLTLGAASVVAATALLAGSAAAQDEVPQGGTIVVGEWQTGNQLNTFLSNSLKDQEPSWIISRPLVTRDETGNYVPEFLTEVPSIDNGGLVLDEDGDGFTVNITMKDGLMWSDGTPFTLHDFKALYDWALAINQANATNPDPESLVACVYCTSFVPTIDGTLTGEAAYAPENLYVESITVADDGLSAEIRFQKNFSGWINALLFQPLINPTYWAAVPPDEIATRAVPGNDVAPRDPDERSVRRVGCEQRRHRLRAESELDGRQRAEPRAGPTPLLRLEGRHVHVLPERRDRPDPEHGAGRPPSTRVRRPGHR